MEARQAGEERGGEERGESVGPPVSTDRMWLWVCALLASPLLRAVRGRRFIGTVPRSSFFRARREGSEVGTGARGVLTPVKLPQRETTSTAQQSILIHANCIEVVITEIEPGRVKEIIFTCERFMESNIFD